VDRYKPAAGYVPENIWIICYYCNLLKRNLSGSDLLTFAWQVVEGFARAQVVRESEILQREVEEYHDALLDQIEAGIL